MKKILILNYEFPPLGGGAANATYYLLKEFSKKKDLQIDLITSSTDKYQKEKFADNINIYFLDIGKKGNIHYQSNKDLLTYSWKAYRKAKKLIKLKNYNIVHAFFGIPCGYIAMKLGLPYIVSLRGSDVPFYNKRFYWMDRLFFKRLSRKIWKKAKAVIANSKGLRDLALESSPRQKIDIIYNGVDIEQFNKNQKSKIINNKFTILYVGRLIKRKGVKYLIDAFAKLNKEKDCQLVIAGSGNQEEELKKQAKDLNQSDYINFLGPVVHDDLPKIYHKSDVYILPSFNEGMSNTVLEAIASGLPIVATDTGGTKELVYNNGIIIEKGNTGSILNALLKLKADADLRQKMGALSLKKAEQMSWAKSAKQYFKLYN